ncbi:conserved hypothetical protein [Chelatococcus asaccharovorans]|nr:conserved hypothetical protein [Chelatococcus asaccharovorans]CAH1677222.1 conserved hypothetical protein [Chelatococcus asaccharovorans]
MRHPMHKKSPDNAGLFATGLTRTTQMLFVVVAAGRWDKAFETPQQVFLAHPVESNIGIIAPGRPRGRSEQRHGIGLGLVHFHIFLHGVDQIFLQIFRREFGIGDLAQRHDRVFVPVAIDGKRCTGGNQPRAVAGEEDELEAILDLVDAILDGDASHERLLLWQV